MGAKKNRWISLFAGVCIEAMLGMGYAWSVFQDPFIEKFGWSITGISYAYTTMCVLTMLLTMILGKLIRQKLRVKQEVLLGGIIYSIAIFGMSTMSGELWELYLWWGIVYPVGTFMSYPVLISYAVELFPDKAGLAGGIMTAGYGVGSVIWAPLVSKIYLDSGDILIAFRILGISFLLGIILFTRFLCEAPRQVEVSPQRHRQSTSAKKYVNSLYETGIAGMVKCLEFYMCVVALLAVLACGGMVVSQGAPIVKQNLQFTATKAAGIVSLLSIANMAGRLLWGTVSDHIGKAKTVGLLNAITVASMFCLLAFENPLIYVGALFCSMLAYGGASSMVAPVTAELFGVKHMAENYTVTFSAFGISGLLGPALISSIRQNSGRYEGAFLCGLIFALAGVIACSIILKKFIEVNRRKSV